MASSSSRAFSESLGGSSKPTWFNEIPKDREVIVYCVKGGSVSQSVTEILQQKQCNVRFIEGGIKAWNESEI